LPDSLNLWFSTRARPCSCLLFLSTFKFVKLSLGNFIGNHNWSPWAKTHWRTRKSKVISFTFWTVQDEREGGQWSFLGGYGFVW
jgi:hypothetical protein